MHDWWDCKLVQSLWRTTSRFLKKLKMKLPYDPAVPPLGIYPKEMKTNYQREICTPTVSCSIIHRSQDRETMEDVRHTHSCTHRLEGRVCFICFSLWFFPLMTGKARHKMHRREELAELRRELCLGTQGGRWYKHGASWTRHLQRGTRGESSGKLINRSRSRSWVEQLRSHHQSLLQEGKQTMQPAGVPTDGWTAGR